MKSEDDLRREIVTVCRNLHQYGYNTSINGNVSVRFDEDCMLITPSGCSMGLVKERDIVLSDMNGNGVTGGNPSSEYRLHAAIYNKRIDANAIIHVHSTHSLALSLFDMDLLNDTYITVSPIPITEYARIGSENVTVVIDPYILRYNWAILRRHGSVAWESDLLSAYHRIEGMEHLCKVLLTAMAVGRPEPMREFARKELLDMWGLDYLGGRTC